MFYTLAACSNHIELISFWVLLSHCLAFLSSDELSPFHLSTDNYKSFHKNVGRADTVKKQERYDDM